MLAGLHHDTVDAIFVKFENSGCPPNTVTLGNGENNGLDCLLTVIGVHENCVTIFRKPLIACFATQQKRLGFTVAGAGRDIAMISNTVIFAFLVRAKKRGKLCHLAPPVGVLRIPYPNPTRQVEQDNSNND
jgi:hypothetical protein